MTEKRFTLIIDTEWWLVGDNTIKVNEFGYREDLGIDGLSRGIKQELTEQEVVDLLNQLHEENEQLKQENKEYAKLFNCRNCGHLDYDWYDDGDEFEVCNMGNTERLVYHRFCKDWKRG